MIKKLAKCFVYGSVFSLFLVLGLNMLVIENYRFNESKYEQLICRIEKVKQINKKNESETVVMNSKRMEETQFVFLDLDFDSYQKE